MLDFSSGERSLRFDSDAPQKTTCPTPRSNAARVMSCPFCRPRRCPSTAGKLFARAQRRLPSGMIAKHRGAMPPPLVATSNVENYPSGLKDTSMIKLLRTREAMSNEYCQARWRTSSTPLYRRDTCSTRLRRSDPLQDQRRISYIQNRRPRNFVAFDAMKPTTSAGLFSLLCGIVLPQLWILALTIRFGRKRCAS